MLLCERGFQFWVYSGALRQLELTQL
uniref:Uncharacterized protein n=1 Tax=Arundo donax TaxID=35708 RepID=A0A0A9EWD6_ARUDO